MDQELETLIKERYKLLPIDVQKAIVSLPLQEIMQKIATENGLHLDRAGILYTETMLVLLGVEKIDSFEKNVRENLGTSTLETSKIVSTLNTKVFLPVRESLKAIQATHTEEIKKEVPIIDSREDILAEIENPTPSVQPISAADHFIAGPAKPLEITPETKETVAHDFIGSKLTETVSLPSQTASVTLKTPEVKPKSYGPDPYREPLM